MAHWTFQPVPQHYADLFRREAGLSAAGAALLAIRGFTDVAAVRRFLHPDLDQLHSPWLLHGMEAAVERIERARREREAILVYGDYDVDGVTSLVVLRKALEMLGADVRHYIPQRLAEGYGLHNGVLDEMAKSAVRLLITVDTGIRAHEAVAHAAALGMDVIVTDHHLPDKELPAATAVLNPHQEACGYPEDTLCGVGIAFKLAQALFERAGKVGRGELPAWLLSFFKMVALGTIADAAALVGENRVFARFGLRGLGEPVNPGLQALLRNGLGERPVPVSAADVAYRIAPRINAAGRMGGADVVVQLFSAAAPEARELALTLDRLNQERQQAEAAVEREIEQRLATDTTLAADRVLVLDGEGWHRGVLGIVATRLCRRYQRPTLVAAREGDTAHGSGRAPEGVHLLRMMEECAPLFERLGGHAQALGFALPCSRLGELRQRLNEGFAAQPAQPETLRLDLEIRLDELAEGDSASYGLLADLRQFEPFGSGNPAPVFCTRGAALLESPRILKEKHLKFVVGHNGLRFDALAWGQAEQRAADVQGLAPGSVLDLAYTVEVEEHPRYGRRVQLILRDFRRAAAAAQNGL
jgi:single-stranded-DNA-specific exonuclease